MAKYSDNFALTGTVSFVHHLYESFLCFCCYGNAGGLLTDKNADPAFIDIGFNNWKKALQRFEQHTLSNAHKEVVLKISLLYQPSVSTQLNSQ